MKTTVFKIFRLEAYRGSGQGQLIDQYMGNAAAKFRPGRGYGRCPFTFGGFLFRHACSFLQTSAGLGLAPLLYSLFSLPEVR